MSGFASRPWLIVPLCAVIHATYALIYLLAPAVAHITALHLLHDLIGPLMAPVLLAVAVLSLTPLAVHSPAWAVHLFLWPQQFVLFLMAASALEAVAFGTYPDGVVRPSLFILADQCYAPYLALAHLAATVRNARFR